MSWTLSETLSKCPSFILYSSKPKSFNSLYFSTGFDALGATVLYRTTWGDYVTGFESRLVLVSKALYHTCFICGRRCKWWSRRPKLTSSVISDVKPIIYIYIYNSVASGSGTVFSPQLVRTMIQFLGKLGISPYVVVNKGLQFHGVSNFRRWRRALAWELQSFWMHWLRWRCLVALGRVTFGFSFLGEVERRVLVLHCSRSCAGDTPMSGSVSRKLCMHRTSKCLVSLADIWPF